MYGHYDGQCCDPCGFGQQQYGYGHQPQVAGVSSCGGGKGFALIVVLFILLIIVGASKYYG
ncbi:sporulation protein YjcZ [Salipaludibacillus keqinensis]|jgi:uncharacterized protein (TIGR01732 family)|uniref:Sporulation protein YjcZ n=1 Tax=Salipaludibacillus keqinensis TaxID=2045207 RepID=A0A323TL71_9BACI|nr:YjcZ family sporulation protein [Salipaludibacillus keqinensis]PYZ93303.1 sporulation protein YjcZ [Salipaludibacillus keqinensis]